MTEELIKYIIHCVLFHHDFDNSCKITEDAEEKENRLFEESILFLQHIDSLKNCMNCSSREKCVSKCIAGEFKLDIAKCCDKWSER